MKDYRTLQTKVSTELICLKQTKKIGAEDLSNAEWAALSDQYIKADNNILKAIYTLINSIMFQRRAVFVLTRESLSEMIKKDKNHVRAGLRNEDYKTILGQAFEMKLFKGITVEAHKGRPHAYEVLDQDILSFINVNVDEQRSQALKFCARSKSAIGA